VSSPETPADAIGEEAKELDDADDKDSNEYATENAT